MGERSLVPPSKRFDNLKLTELSFCVQQQVIALKDQTDWSHRAENILGQVIKANTTVDVEISKRFSPVYVADGNVITLPDELRELWQGSYRSAVKLDTCIELNTGQLQCGLQHGKQSHNRSPLANAVYERGSLRVQDVGYFNLERIQAQAERG